MVQIKLTATELVNTETNIVSMVKRGANRIPFRMVKEDNEDMLDLYKLGAKVLLKNEGAKKGGIFAVIVNKTADIAALATLLADTGLKLEKGEDGEGVTVFKQEGVDEFDVGVLKLDDNVAVAVSGLKKGFSSYNWQDTDFASVFATESFYPTMYQATDAFCTTVYNIMSKQEDKSAALTMIAKAHTDFGSLVSTLVSAIPETAMKAETLLKAEASKATLAATTAVTAEATKTEETVEAKADDAVKTEEAAASADDAKTDEAVKAETTEEAPKVEETKKGDDDLLAKLGDLIATTVAKAMEPVTAAQAAIKDELAAVNTKVDGVATETKKTEQLVKGTVIASSHPDRTVTTKKQDSGNVIPLLDTGYGRA